MDNSAPPSDSAAPSADQPHVYQPGSSTVVMIYLMAGLLFVIGLFMLSSPRGALAILIFWGAGAFAASQAYATSVQRLSLTTQGLEYRDWTGTTKADWEDVKGIVMVDARRGRVPNLTLANSNAQVPLVMFGGGDWRDGPLGQDLQAWAPRLLQDYDTRQT